MSNNDQFPRLKDVLILELSTGPVLRWEVLEVRLGGENQEGIVYLEPLDLEPLTFINDVERRSSIPPQMLDRLIQTGSVELWRRVEETS